MIPAARLALFLLAAGLCLFQAQGLYSPQDCCLATIDKPISLKHLRRFKGYELQDTMGGCSIKAFVLITIHNRKLCFPLESSVAVQFKEALDNKLARKKMKSLRRW